MKSVKKKKLVICLFTFALMSFLYVGLSVNNEKIASVLTLDEIEALADVELSEVVITCSGGSSGRCFYILAEEGLFGACRFDCKFSGSQSDYCSGIWVEICNFCSAFCVANGG